MDDVFDVDDLLRIRQRWKKKGKRIVKKKTFGMRMLEKSMDGAAIDLGWVHGQHRAAIKAGEWKWHQAGAKARGMSGGERVSRSLRQSKAIEEVRLDVNDFLPSHVDIHQKERLNLGVSVMKELRSGASTCDWKKYDRTGAYTCSNAKHTPGGKYCPFHISTCVQQDEHEKPQKIYNPNMEALCDDCYLGRHHKLPPKLRLGIPGVLRENMERTGKIGKITATLGLEKSDANKWKLKRTDHAAEEAANAAPRLRTEHSITKRGQRWEKRRQKRFLKEQAIMQKAKAGNGMCDWHGEDEQGWRYKCLNECTLQKQSGTVLRQCKWHVKTCLLDSPWRPLCEKIVVPNKMGACRNHFVSAYNGKEPKPIAPHMVPGVKCLHEPERPPDLDEPHVLAPRDVPVLSQGRKETLEAIFAPPPPKQRHCCYRFFCVKLNYYRRFKNSMWRKRRWHKAYYATQITKIVRGFVARARVRRMFLLIREAERDVASVILQKNIRAHFARRFFFHHLEDFSWAVPTINRVMRGAIARLRYRRLRSATRLQRWWRCVMARDQIDALRLKNNFMKQVEEKIRRAEERKISLLGRLWKDICSNRIMRWWRKWWTYQNVQRRILNAITIQRIFRGWIGRQFAWRWERLSHASALTIQRVWRGFTGRVYAKWYIATMMQLVPAMQRLVRGHLARKRAEYERHALEENWNWLNPSMPRAAFSNHLARNNPYRKNIYLKTPDPFYYPNKPNVSPEFKGFLQEVGNIGTIKHTSEDTMRDLLIMQRLAQEQQQVNEEMDQEEARIKAELQLAKQRKHQEMLEAKESKEAGERGMARVERQSGNVRKPSTYYFLFQSHLFHGQDGRLLNKDELKTTMKNIYRYPQLDDKARGHPRGASRKKMTLYSDERLREQLQKRLRRLDKYVPPLAPVDASGWDHSSLGSNFSGLMDIVEEQSEVALDPRAIRTPPPSAVSKHERLNASQGLVYLDMLLALSNEDLQLIENKEAFTGYIFSSWLWMDALWQNIVSDIRTGTISAKVPDVVLNERGWKYVKSTLRPNPGRAALLEEALRNMCFHTRAGKLAETLERLGIGSRGGTSSRGENTVVEDVFPGAPDAGETLDELSNTRSTLFDGSQVVEQAQDRGNVSPQLSSRTDVEEDFGTPYSAILLKQQHDFDTTGYDNTSSRFDDPYWPKSERRGADAEEPPENFRFVCSLPGCGKCSSSAQGSHDHYIMEHGNLMEGNAVKLKTASKIEHLIAPTWPSDVPWQQSLLQNDTGSVIGVSFVWPEDSFSRSDMFGKKRFWDLKQSGMINRNVTAPSGRAFFCKRTGCRMRFSNVNDLVKHQSEHRGDEIREESQRQNPSLHLEWRGLMAKVPKAVKDSIVQCERHRFAIPSDCMSCRLVLERFQPKQPATWYRKLHFRPAGYTESISITTDFESLVSPMIDPAWTRRKYGEFDGVARRQDNPTPLLLHVLGICMDDYERPIIAGRYYYTSESAVSMGKIFSEDIPTNFVENEEVFEDEAVHFVPVSAVVGYGIVVRCSRLRWSSYQNLPLLKNAPVAYFSRILLAPAGQRIGRSTIVVVK
jgi:hypothetical protein